MSVIHRQLHRIESSLHRSDPRLTDKLRVFGKLSAGEAMPAREQVPSRQHGIRRNHGNIVARQPRTAFVLAGGAALGAMQAGMVRALYERGITPDLFIGTSAGALNAAFLASRPATVDTAEELAAVWRGVRRSDILPLRPATLISGLAGRHMWRRPASGLVLSRCLRSGH